MITYETTKTIRDLIENAGEEYGSRAFLRYENNNIIYDLSFEKFTGICRIIGAWANAQRTAKGHRIKAALFGSASTHYIPVLLGVMGSGNTAVPLDIQLDKEHLADCLNRSDIDVLFYDREHEPLISEMRDLCPGIGAYYSLQSVRDVPCLNDILRDPRFTGHEWAGQGEEGSVAPEDLAMILFTSGTTGYSKGVMLSNGNLLDNVFSRDMDEEPGTNVYLSVLPIHHVFCISSDYLIGLEEGATVCINGPLSALTRHLILFEPTVMRMVPMIAKSLYNKMAAIASADPGLTEQEIFRQIYGRNLIRITCGGGGLPPELAQKYYDAGIKIGQGYGMSECSPIISSPVFDRPDKFASAGKKVRRCEIRTAADGELQVQSPSVMQGYYGDPELTKEAFTEDGWLRTGDLGYLDEEGFVYLTGRLKNLIILSNGENVAPEELEGLFAPEPIVQDILVFGEDDKIMCEIYPDFAYAQANGISDIQAELEAVVRRINEGLPTYKRILRTGMRKSPFLKTTSKKIIRDAFFKERSLQKKTEEDFKRPGNDEEQAIFKLCAETLGHRRFGVDTNLFENGLDSFGSIMLRTALQEKLGFSATITDLLEHPTVEQLTELKEQKKKAPRVDYTKRPVYPLTRLQMYFAYVMRGNTTANLPFFFKLNSSVELDRLEEAIRKLFLIHPILSDHIEPGEDGRLANFRDDNREIHIERMTLSEEEWEEKRHTLLRPYTYTPGEDLYHIGIYSAGNAGYLYFDIAHIIGDGMTMHILLDDLNRLYMKQPVQSSDYTFYEYILDEFDRDERGLRDKDIAFIQELLKGYSVRKSILAKKDSYDLTTAHNATLRGRFKSLTPKRIRGFGEQYGVSENVIFLTAFNYCISLYGYGDDVVSTSIHNGRTDGRWARVAGSFFGTYLFRYQRVAHETVPELLKRSGSQILHTMECHISSQHADEMFIQYQGDLLHIPQIGGAETERMSVRLDSLPFHLMIYSDEKSYTYELRYWENRFDREMLETFLSVMESVIYAMPEESSVRRLKEHIPEKLYPRHFTIPAGRLNASLGQPVIENVGEKTPVKVYVLDEYGKKKPYGAWGRLYVLDHPTGDGADTMESLYTPGTLYDTGIEARITPAKQVEALYQAGRTVMKESLTGRAFPNLFEIERLLATYPGVRKAEAALEYGENNLFYLTAHLTVEEEPETEKVQAFVADRLGKQMVPSFIYFEH